MLCATNRWPPTTLKAFVFFLDGIYDRNGRQMLSHAGFLAQGA